MTLQQLEFALNSGEIWENELPAIIEKNGFSQGEEDMEIARDYSRNEKLYFSELHECYITTNIE